MCFPFSKFPEVLFVNVVLPVARHALQFFRARAQANDGVGSTHAEFSSVFSTRVKITARKRLSSFFFEFPMSEASGIHDTSLASARIFTISLGPSGGTSMFQGIVERVPRKPTACAPSTMILIFAPKLKLMPSQQCYRHVPPVFVSPRMTEKTTALAPL